MSCIAPRVHHMRAIPLTGPLPDHMHIPFTVGRLHRFVNPDLSSIHAFLAPTGVLTSAPLLPPSVAQGCCLRRPSTNCACICICICSGGNTLAAFSIP